MLKRLSGLSRSALKKTRELLGAEGTQPHTPPHTPAGAEASSRPPDAPADPGSVRSGRKAPGGKAGQARPGADGRQAGGSRAADAKPAAGKARAAGKPKRSNSNSGKDSKDSKSGRQGKSLLTGSPRVVAQGDHPVSRKSIARSALKVLDRLHEAGFGAFLVGGGVRDALVGMEPKDFDIATDASPEDVRALFRNSRIIGRRFRLVHVVFGREIIEVATFRAAHDKGEGGEIGASGRIVRDNVFGSIEEDALRRDFSVNALYYNVADGAVVDYAGGLEDIERKVFRLIGDPLTRCEEDPVRVLRAVRLSAKLGFSIDKATDVAMRQVAPELAKTPPARLFEEVLKLFQGGYAERSFAAVREHDLLRYIFPSLQRRLDENPSSESAMALATMLDAALANTDRRVAQGKPITPSYLLAFMLWPDVEEQARILCRDGVPVHEALREAADGVLGKQLRVISIPRRFSGPMKEIWQMQPRLERLVGSRALKLIDNRRFRAAYDFFCLRGTIDERLAASADWWTDVQELPGDARQAFAADRPVALGLWEDGSDDAEDIPDTDPDADEARPGASGRRPRRRGGRKRTEDAAVATGEAVAVERAAEPETADAGEAPPKKKRRRRRRRPGGDRARSPDGNSG